MIFPGQTTVGVVGGQGTPVSLILNPVVDDVAVSPSFQAARCHVASVGRQHGEIV